MLEKVREPGAALSLVARADIVGDGEGNDRCAVILSEDHAEAVLELHVLKIYFDRFRDGCCLLGCFRLTLTVGRGARSDERAGEQHTPRSVGSLHRGTPFNSIDG